MLQREVSEAESTGFETTTTCNASTSRKNYQSGYRKDADMIIPPSKEDAGMTQND